MIAAVLLSMILSIGNGTSVTTTCAMPAAPSTRAEAISANELQLAMRDLWTGHVFWVRSYVVASHYRDEAGAGAAEAKVVENARAIADAIVPFYGQEAADRLFGLLAGHYGAVKDYMKVSYTERSQDGEAAAKRLSANAKELAAFLAGANPHLPEAAVLPLLLAHGGHHIQQIDAVRERDFTGEAAVGDAMLGHIQGIADALADALARQFPDQVAG